mmetsp:Transcript_5277/g.17823  ORF Transcript_5277/g.17823 Transcript_5277/m.17823 type:complete len:490 (+) Transcript_5277:1099-2568(+)
MQPTRCSDTLGFRRRRRAKMCRAMYALHIMERRPVVVATTCRTRLCTQVKGAHSGEVSSVNSVGMGRARKPAGSWVRRARDCYAALRFYAGVYFRPVTAERFCSVFSAKCPFEIHGATLSPLALHSPKPSQVPLERARGSSGLEAEVLHLGHVVAFVPDVLGVVGQLASELVHELSVRARGRLVSGSELEHLDGEVPAGHLVDHGHVEGRGGGALLDVAAHLPVLAARAAVEEAAHDLRVAMEGHHHGRFWRENGLEGGRVEAPRVAVGGGEAVELDDVDEAQGHVRGALLEEGRGGDGLEGGHVAAAREDGGGRRAHGRRRGEGPLGEALRHGASGLLGAEPLGHGVLARHDGVDPVLAREALRRHGEERVCVRREVGTHHGALLGGQVVQEAGGLVGVAVVVLAPGVGGEEHVEARHGLAPADLEGRLEPLGVLVDHRVHELGKGLVGGEHAVAPRQHVALEPPLARVLREDLHHAAVRRRVRVARA